MRAKFNCDSVTEYSYGNKEAKLSAVYGTNDKDNEENNQFAEATPSGNITIQVDKNAVAKDYLVPGKTYYVDFTEVD